MVLSRSTIIVYPAKSNSYISAYTLMPCLFIVCLVVFGFLLNNFSVRTRRHANFIRLKGHFFLKCICIVSIYSVYYHNQFYTFVRNSIYKNHSRAFLIYHNNFALLWRWCASQSFRFLSLETTIPQDTTQFFNIQ